MKKIIQLIALFLLTSNIFGQITLEHSYPNGKWQTTMVKLSNSGYKYQWVNVTTGQLKLYNLDHSLFKSMSFPIITGLTGVWIIYVSENTFNLDNDVEFMLYYQEDGNWVNSGVKIINEKGTVIFDKASETPAINSYGGIESIINTPNGTKMILDNHSDSSAKVYSLPGTLIVNAIKNIDMNDHYNKFIETYPNPADNYIKLAYTLPTNIKIAHVSIFDVKGKIVKTYIIDNNYKELLIDTQDFTNGTYFCEIKSDDIKISDSKFIIQK
jgi:hypothetical protein